MIQALFRRHQEYISNKNQHGYDDGSKCPQMMVTASPVLAAAIKGNFNALCASNSSGQYEMQPISISQEQDVKTMESNDPSSLIRFDSIAADTYPLITTFDAFLRTLETMNLPPVLVAETRLRPLSDPMRMNGCALVILNDPPGTEQEAAIACDWAARVLGEPGGLGRAWRL